MSLALEEEGPANESATAALRDALADAAPPVPDQPRSSSPPADHSLQDLEKGAAPVQLRNTLSSFFFDSSSMPYILDDILVAHASQATAALPAGTLHPRRPSD